MMTAVNKPAFSLLKPTSRLLSDPDSPPLERTGHRLWTGLPDPAGGMGYRAVRLPGKGG